MKSKADIKKLCEFWIQIHGLPFDCRGQSVVKAIGQRIGKVTEEECELESRGVQQRKFIRLKVEMDLLKPLVKGFILMNEGEKKWLWIKYERLPKFCSACGLMGHTA